MSTSTRSWQTSARELFAAALHTAREDEHPRLAGGLSLAMRIVRPSVRRFARAGKSGRNSEKAMATQLPRGNVSFQPM